MRPFDVATFGETMIRLSPPGHERLETAHSLQLRIGGSESNTAIALARLGRSVAWWSRLPRNPLGRRIAADIARWGVDVSHIVWSDSGRAGVYFIEFGAPPRPHEILYDRQESQASRLAPQDVDWSLLDQARHLHLTGITAALSDSCARTVALARSEAAARGLTVSFDVNYRGKLWTPARCREVLQPILREVDLLLCPLADAKAVFGLDGNPESVASQLGRLTRAKAVVVTAGAGGALLAADDQILRQDAIPAVEVDRVGAGDAFSAGLLDGFLDGDLARGLRMGVAMASLKHTLPGDHLISTRDEIEHVLAGLPPGIRR